MGDIFGNDFLIFIIVYRGAQLPQPHFPDLMFILFILLFVLVSVIVIVQQGGFDV